MIPNMFLWAENTIGIKTGSMLIFPSHLLHWDEPNNTDKDRYSLAMNFMPKGNIVFGDSSYNYQ